jgi:hypothetical protein
VVAAGLLWWSVTAIRRRSPVPGWLRRRHLLAATAAVVAYWLLRMALTYGLGVEGFPGFPPG